MSKDKVLEELVNRLNALDTKLTIQHLKSNVLSHRISALEDDDEDEKNETEEIEDEKKTGLTIGQAIDLLKSGEAEKISCYVTDHTYMYVCEDKDELRTKALNGIDYPWVIKDRELEASFRVIE